MRSKGTVDVSWVAARLGGGGHRAAAGFTRDGTVGQVLSEVRSALAAHARPLAS
jgi:phosphoesterase RecJ-like protein